MANEFGFLIDSRNGQKPAETSNGSQPKGALLLTPGCLRGIEDVGAYCAFDETGIAQHFHGRFGTSVGAISILFADNPLLGLGIFSKLTGHNFVKLKQQDMHVPGSNRVLVSAETYRMLQVARTVLTSRAADITGIDRMRSEPYIDSAYLSHILHHVIVPDFEKIKASNKEYRVYYTNAKTGQAMSYDLRDAATLEEALLRVNASSRLPLISGPPVKIGDDLAFDGCYSASYPVHDIVDRGYNRIVMLLSMHPDDVLQSEGELGRLIDTYARVHAKSSVEVYAEYRNKLPALLEEMLSGEIKTEKGSAHIRIIHPEKIDPKMNPLETDPHKLEEAFERGYARGKIFVSQIEREHLIVQMERQRAHNEEYVGRAKDALGLRSNVLAPIQRAAYG